VNRLVVTVSRRRAAARAKDFILYIAIAVTVFTVLIAFAFYTAKTGRPITAFELNWIALAGTTVLGFGETIRISRRLWRARRFWYVVAAGLFVQLGLGTVILWDAPRISTLIWGCLVFPATFAALQAGIARFTRDRASHATEHGGPTMR
jgi:hypothetical protein